MDIVDDFLKAWLTCSSLCFVFEIKKLLMCLLSEKNDLQKM